MGPATLRGDREALALAVVIVIGLVLLRRGTGTLGVVFLSLVFGDFLVWTMWAAMNNLRHGEEPEDVTLPAVLAVLSSPGWSPMRRRRDAWGMRFTAEGWISGLPCCSRSCCSSACRAS